ncbi:uncharacterized protein STEHIDRAFT_157908 [Stereum hirsutum FP-91666 SS1]|uniref:uncharacterized protein n=1 Tax=Stereum hirsutum (strain FP-91666) TaxID=721885 RepID=UPI000444A546|nr:uncharacterized protein STEHIDRAFT_157908 [Stereum hirsutum FP-91666 SS1]EIM85267.1 hypothetical protein STEHIDRAFT_157908 [Stereum hirsutum FP-91666 SS1]
MHHRESLLPTYGSKGSNFAGVFVGGVAYGIHTAVFAAATYFIISAYKALKRLPWSFLIFIFSLFTLGTIDIACNTKFGDMMWIDDRNIPGGPNAWLEAGYSTPVNVLGSASYIFSNFLADAMIIYRLWVIWSYNWYIIIIPILSFLASTALSILTIYETAQPGASLWSHITLGFSVPYWSLSIALNILVTLAIVYRLVAMKRRIGRLLSPAHSRMYTSLSSMVIESAALYSITGMIFIICYARSSSVQNIVLPILGQVMCIAPELIILRVARGRAWSSNTVTLLEGTTATGVNEITTSLIYQGRRSILSH